LVSGDLSPLSWQPAIQLKACDKPTTKKNFRIKVFLQPVDCRLLRLLLDDGVTPVIVSPRRGGDRSPRAKAVTGHRTPKAALPRFSHVESQNVDDQRNEKKGEQTGKCAQQHSHQKFHTVGQVLWHYHGESLHKRHQLPEIW
jgi:hypothetical protein